jgi:hypothetical protein
MIEIDVSDEMTSDREEWRKRTPPTFNELGKGQKEKEGYTIETVS